MTGVNSKEFLNLVIKRWIVVRSMWEPCFQKGNRTSGPLTDSFSTSWAASRHPCPLSLFTLLPGISVFSFCSLNFSDVFLHPFSHCARKSFFYILSLQIDLENISVMKRHTNWFKKNFLDHKLLVCWKLLYIKRTHFLKPVNLKNFYIQKAPLRIV